MTTDATIGILINIAPRGDKKEAEISGGIDIQNPQPAPFRNNFRVDLRVHEDVTVTPEIYQEISKFLQALIVPKEPFDNPEKEVKADVLAVEKGLSTVTQVLADQGKDLEQFLKERQNDESTESLQKQKKEEEQ